MISGIFLHGKPIDAFVISLRSDIVRSLGAPYWHDVFTRKDSKEEKQQCGEKRAEARKDPALPFSRILEPVLSNGHFLVWSKADLHEFGAKLLGEPAYADDLLYSFYNHLTHGQKGLRNFSKSDLERIG